ncbi:LysR family transcriptional regulator, partial [Xanthomonas perforans]
MVRFDDLALFVRTAALGSFSSAAREADLLPGQASAAVARLERALDLRLFARSTRSLRLTAEGEQYLPYARGVLELLRDGREHVRGADSALQGLLQVTAPSDLGRNVLLPWLTEFRAAHPKLTLRLHLSDQVADLYRAPVDVAFRLGRIDDAEHVALPLAPDNRRVLVAAP